MKGDINLFEYCSKIRGFNYNPSYCSTAYEIWDRFDKEIWQIEINNGKKQFPILNALRIWLDWAAYLRNPEKFIKNMESVLCICEENEIDVHPTLFNRWHNLEYDFGGVYYEHFIDRNYKRFEKYVEDVIGTFKNDLRINMWDLCNEPQHMDKKNPLHQIEFDWLRWVNDKVRKIGASQPITIGTMFGSNVEWVVDVCDVICFHPYSGWWNDEFRNTCEDMVNLAIVKKKPIIANETCQGSLYDDIRTKIIHKSLGILKEYEIGWYAWQLYGGRMLSANAEITDNNCKPGDKAYMAFIDRNGILRKGHEAYNEY